MVYVNSRFNHVLRILGQHNIKGAYQMITQLNVSNKFNHFNV